MMSDVFRPPRQPVVPPGGVELMPRDMTATFSADLTLREAQDRLAEVGQWLPVDGGPGRTLGELVEWNSTGPLRLGYGAWRDLLLGAQFENGRGELISAGGKTVKNVAGYDLTKFIVGSAGVFGTLVTLTTRTYSKPAGALLCRTRDADVATLNRLMPTPLKPQWAILNAEGFWLGYLGDEPTLAYYRRSCPQADLAIIHDWSVEDDIAHRASLWASERRLTFRASIPPTRLMEISRKLACVRWAADAAFGTVVGIVPDGLDLEMIRDAVRAVDGTVRFVDCSGPSPRLLEISTNPVERQIIERLKREFDPDGKLNPLPWQIR